MKNTQPIQELKIYLCVVAFASVALGLYYSKIKNTHIRDDQLSARGCYLFAFFIFAVADILGMLGGFNFWYVTGLIICLVMIYGEIAENIPRALRIEEAKKKNQPLYTACGLKRPPPNYDIDWNS